VLELAVQQVLELARVLAPESVVQQVLELALVRGQAVQQALVRVGALVLQQRHHHNLLMRFLVSRNCFSSNRLMWLSRGYHLSSPSFEPKRPNWH
jgi:hypothetical protein